MTKEIHMQASGASSAGSHYYASNGLCLRRTQLASKWTQLVEPSYRKQGTVEHDALAWYYGSKMDTKPTWWEGLSLEEILERSAAGNPEMYRTALEFLEQYKKRWSRETWIPVAVEEEYILTLGELFGKKIPEDLRDRIITCRTDLIIENNGYIFAVDHKTKGHDQYFRDKLPRWDGDFGEAKKYGVSWQINVNMHILRHPKYFGAKMTGFIINRATRTAPWDFDRNTITLPHGLYNGMVDSVIESARQQERLVQIGEAPAPMSLWACYQDFPCDFLEVCGSTMPDKVLETKFARRA